MRYQLRTFRVPIIVYPKVHCGIGSKVKISGDGKLFIGCRWPLGRFYPSLLRLHDRASVVINGSMSVYTGTSFSVNEGASLTLGSGYINEGLILDCFHHISFGENVVISKNVTIRDSDNHSINDKLSYGRPIMIGNHVWIGLNATVLKGVTIGDGSIIAAGSVVQEDIPPRCLAAGVPAKIRKTEVSWS